MIDLLSILLSEMRKLFLVGILCLGLIGIMGCSIFSNNEKSVKELISIPYTEPNGEVLTVHFIDVGVGDCTLIDYGETEIIIDSGFPDPFTVEYISRYVNGDVEAVISTNSDEGHIGNMASIFNTFVVNYVYDNGSCSEILEYVELLSNEDEVVHLTPKRGEIVYIGGLKFTVLNPTVGSDNDSKLNSLALVLKFGEVTFYFMSDVNKETEVNIVDSFNLPKATVLQPGNNGGDESCSRAFLNAISPDYVIYSAIIDDNNDHPSEKNIERWLELGSFFIGTDITGHLRFSTIGTLETCSIDSQH